jgi:predicted RNA methylase
MEDRQSIQEQENTAKVNNAKTINELTGVFQTIVVDPPWGWGDKKNVNQMGRAKHDKAFYICLIYIIKIEST